MPQAMRQHRRPEHSRRKLTVLIPLLLTCVLVIPGCASLGFTDQLLSNGDSRGDDPSTIRSQNVSEADEAPRTGSTVTADYSPLRAPNDSSAMNSAAPTNSKGVVPVFATGHAFVQRRAKLGRPIPIRNQIVTQTAERIESIASSTANQNFNAGDAAPLPLQTPVVQDGVSFGAAGWQPAPESNTATSEIAAARRPRQNDLAATGDVWNSDGRMNPAQQTSNNTERLVPSADVNSRNAIVEDAEARNLQNETSGNINSDAMDDAEVTNDAEVTDGADAGADGTNAIPKEQTVLDRLRGLYSPRRDEAAMERSRKASRRWTDPFGLMREGDPETVESQLGATSPVPSNPEMSADATTGPVTTAASDDLTLLFEPLIEKLEQQLAEWPRQANGKPRDEAEWRQHQTDLRLLYLMAGRSAESMRAIESLPDKEQEFWQTMMLAMEAYRGSSDAGDRTEQLTETLDYLRTASRHLQPLSEMKIRRMNFCDRIDGFGNFNVFPNSDFNAGQPLLLYSEIENYMSELTDDGQYRSEFAARIEFIRDGETEPIASRTIWLPEIEDLCSAERTDYFQSYELTIPSLSPGRYTLRLRVDDQLSLQTATSALQFDIRPLGSAR